MALLVLTSFAEQFKDSVAAAIMIDPINEKEVQTKEYQKSQIITKFRRNIEKLVQMWYYNASGQTKFRYKFKRL